MLLNISNLIPIKFLYTDSKCVLNLIIENKNLLLCLKFLKDYQILRFKMLSTLTCTDFPELINRFELTYTLLSLDFPMFLNLKIKVAEFVNVDSVSVFFKSAVWLEREVWDMFGVYFINNFDLRRILTDYGFPYHPLRKTFPLQGFSEITYNYIKKKIVYVPNTYSQVKPLKNVVSNWVKLN